MNTLKIQNLILDLVIVVLALFVWLVFRLEFTPMVRLIYLWFLLAGVFYFGIKHHERQLYITLLFLLGLFILNIIYGQDDYYFYILYSAFMSMLSLVSYFYPMKYRDEHLKLNEYFVQLREEYNLAIENNKKADQKIDFYNKNVDIMFNIYNLSRKMITTVDTSSILELCIEFFDKSFIYNDFFIFDYDGAHNRYTILFQKQNITEELLFKFGVYLKSRFKNTFFETKEVKPILLNQEKLSTLGFYDFVDSSIKYILFVPIIRRDKFIKVSVIFFKDEKFINYLNLEYFDIFAKQMSLGILKIDMYEEIQEKSIKDSLTNLYRRTFLEEKFDHEVKRSIRENTSMAVLMIDIDFFKDYNDKHGHLLGDKVLAHVSETLKKVIYDTDIVARYGGEEFLVIMPRVDRKKAISKAEKIRKEIEIMKCFDAETDDVENITVSIGISCFPEDGETKQVLIEKADNALYYAKNNGRNKVVDYLEVKKVLF